MKAKKIINCFKELEKEWGNVVLMDHLVDKTNLEEDELKNILEELKSKKVISELKQGCFVRN